MRKEIEAACMRREEIVARKLDVGEVGVDDFNNLALLGVGTFGVVSLVKHTRIDLTLALAQLWSNADPTPILTPIRRCCLAC